jgi:uncharacterized protein (DUF2147 family)
MAGLRNFGRMIMAVAVIFMLAGVQRAVAAADLASPSGRWHLIDDETGSERGVIDLTEADGVVQGRMVSAVGHPGESSLCVKCEGDRKDKPIVGMIILWGLKADGAVWDGGKILDPTKGQIYDAKVSLIEGGRKLKVRAFIGVSLFGRTQVWVREN